jgi:hypothetical protein
MFLQIPYLAKMFESFPLSLSKKEVKEKRRGKQHRSSLFFLFYEVSHSSRSHIVPIMSYPKGTPPPPQIQLPSAAAQKES